MLAPFPLEILSQFAAEDSLQSILSREIPLPARIAAIQKLLDGPARELLRAQLGRWVVQFLPVEDLVPSIYMEWRPLVHDAMVFMLSHLSTVNGEQPGDLMRGEIVYVPPGAGGAVFAVGSITFCGRRFALL